MKFNLKNRPETINPPYSARPWCNPEKSAEWFEGFEKELRERLDELKNTKGRLPLHARCHIAGEIETIEEILALANQRS